MSAHVFMAEDERPRVTLWKYNLEKEGHKVSLSKNGEKALKLMKDKQPDLIVLDWMLQDLYGKDLRKNIQTAAHHPTNTAEQIHYIVEGKYQEGERPKGTEPIVTGEK